MRLNKDVFAQLLPEISHKRCPSGLLYVFFFPFIGTHLDEDSISLEWDAPRNKNKVHYIMDTVLAHLTVDNANCYDAWQMAEGDPNQADIQRYLWLAENVGQLDSGKYADEEWYSKMIDGLMELIYQGHIDWITKDYYNAVEFINYRAVTHYRIDQTIKINYEAFWKRIAHLIIAGISDCYQQEVEEYIDQPYILEFEKRILGDDK